MCRIAGIFNYNSPSIKDDIIRMRDSMHRGGPDDEGIYIDDTLPLALGHRRLALIDLSSAGHQPMSDDKENLQIIFNGEIYNFQELKDQLEASGYVFQTKTDTEVILKSFLKWGIHCFEKFNGMFALSIWNKKDNELILARDHAGIKPLYYSVTKDNLIFASEIRAFKAYNNSWAENPEWKIPFLTFGHLPEPFTTLQNVQPLTKGTCAIIKLPSLDIRVHTFNEFKFTSTITDLKTAIADVKRELERSVQRHLISDAPIGLFLSGGIDSSILTLIANKYIGKKLKTLSITFDDATLNEEPYQNLIVSKTNADHRSFLVTEKEFADELPDILSAMDQPSNDGINSYFICKYARQYGLTAVLSGVGADELFGGYNSFKYPSTVDFIQKLPAFIPGLSNLSSKEKIKKISFLKRKDATGEYLFNRGFFSVKQTAQLLSISETEVSQVLDKITLPPLNKNEDNRNRVSSLETNLYMQNQLLKDTDYMSMWHSLEVRVPFLDKEVMKLAYSISPEIKFDKNTGKHLLIKAFADVLPEEIYNRKKQGFTFPFYKWMHNIEPVERNDKYRKLRYLYKANRLNWSRYWAYLLCNKENIKHFSPGHKSFLFLNLTAFISNGGIEKFNRSFLKALSGIESEGSITADAASLHDKEADDKYFSKSNYSPFSGDRIKFVKYVIKNSKYYDAVIVGHINLAMPSLFSKLRSAKIKLFLIAHGIEVWKPLKGIKRSFLKKVNTILAVSNFTKEKIINVQQIDESKIKIFNNTLDPYFDFPADFKKPEYLKNRYQLNGQTIIYTLGRLSSGEQYKGYDKVLHALPELKKSIPHIKYIIAGKADAVEKLRIENLIKDLNIEENVLLTGFINNEEVVDHYLLADTFIMPSTMEGFGIVFIEAMACGVPVIAGNVDGSVDALMNGKLGKLINPLSNKEIVDSIVQVQSQNILAGAELQKNVQEQFGFDHFKNQLKNILAA